MTVVLTGQDLTLEQVLRVARDYARVDIADEALARLAHARGVVEQALASGEAVYGLTTGVGARKGVRVTGEELAVFNRALILDHRVGQGPPAPEDVVRATMLRLANGLAQGTTCARPELLERVVQALNERQHPTVRLLGSIGQSDLAPMADLAYGIVVDFPLEAGEAIALLNSNAFSTALAALALADCGRLLDALDVAGALDLEAFAANPTVLHPAIADVRPHPGLRATRDRLAELLQGSFLWEEGAARSLQDPLSYRCLPQVHGAARDALDHALRTLSIELNAHQGNPLVVVQEERIVSVSNFDIAPLAASLDFVRLALAPALTCACERLIKLLNRSASGLPLGLAARDGLAEDSLAELGVAAQALAAEARLLAQPVSFELVSSSQQEGIEDRMTMAPLAARRLAEMVELGARLVSIELVVACQAVDLRGSRLGAGTRHAYAQVRRLVPFKGEGEPLPHDLDPLVELVGSGSLSPSLRSAKADPTRASSLAELDPD
ncbi:MAG: hypothetical protein C4305_04625 [Thermoleophilia bacterium]